MRQGAKARFLQSDTCVHMPGVTRGVIRVIAGAIARQCHGVLE